MLTIIFVVLGFISTVAYALPFARARPHSPFAHRSSMKAKRDDSQKYVVAHFMMGNAYPYTTEDFEDDIKLASASGIDAFALNIGTDSWQPDHVRSAYVFK